VPVATSDFLQTAFVHTAKRRLAAFHKGKRNLSRIPGRERSGDNYPALLLLETVAGLLLATILGENLEPISSKQGGSKTRIQQSYVRGLLLLCRIFQEGDDDHSSFYMVCHEALIRSQFQPSCPAWECEDALKMIGEGGKCE
jgi:hypothetical protein